MGTHGMDGNFSAARRHRRKGTDAVRESPDCWFFSAGGDEVGSSRLVVEAVEELAVLLVDDSAIDIEGRRQFPGKLCQLVVEDREALDLIDQGELVVEPVDLLL